MRLSEFIVANMEAILQEFEEFARTHTAAGETMDIRSLRDHAAAMLTTITLDMEQPQGEEAQEQKSKGNAPASSDANPTAAEQHGSDRAGSGFTLDEMFAEYRALRASVLRLWTKSRGTLEESDLQDLIRFNEAIDQALAESITHYSTGIDRSREMFLAILGHDLRTPLSAVITAASFLVSDGGLEDGNLKLANRIRSSGERMQALVSDLLDFTLSRLGRGIPVTRNDIDIGPIGRATIDEINAHHLTRELRFEAVGDLTGQWDGKRVSQAVTNLVANAVQHGTDDTSVQVTARGYPNEVVVSIHNQGQVIGGADPRRIFDPFKRIDSTGTGKDQGSMGLGLYIAQQIAIAHGGRIELDSSEERGTTFELHLPRAG